MRVRDCDKDEIADLTLPRKHLPAKQLMAKVDKGFVRQGFGENICKLFLGVNMLHSNLLAFNVGTKVMILYGDVLGTRA